MILWGGRTRLLTTTRKGKKWVPKRFGPFGQEAEPDKDRSVHKKKGPSWVKKEREARLQGMERVLVAATHKRGGKKGRKG